MKMVHNTEVILVCVFLCMLNIKQLQCFIYFYLLVADERRPSTGSSLYHKVYSSSSSESESEGSESEDDDVESEEGSDEESETESETDDETESESEEEKEQIEDELLIVNKDTKQQILKDQEMAPVLVERETGETIYHGTVLVHVFCIHNYL